ncbi:SpaA isopeptide-forming pilin-related protein [Enterococcus sp. AZ196]|uniref:SpaA isopeptide-forming pilin-related protein n=1 Tax=Enterococcus sp. AZ196 TaxID=2774659 RepID=UPI003D284A7B
MFKMIKRLGKLFFVGMLLLPFIFSAFSENQAAADETMDLTFKPQPARVGDQGDLTISASNPEQVTVEITPNTGLSLTKEKSTEDIAVYKYKANKAGKYTITANRTFENQILESKSMTVNILEATATSSTQPIVSSTISGAADSADIQASSTRDSQTQKRTSDSSSAEGFSKQAPSGNEKIGAARGATLHQLSESDAAKLGNLWDYNAYLTGQHSANMADTEGAIAVKGDSLFPDDLQTFTYGASFRENNTTIGEPIREDQYVNVLIGGKIDNRATSEWVKPVVENRTTNGKTQGWLVGRSNMTDWIYKNLGEWFSAVAYKADDSVIDSTFARLQSQENQMVTKLEELTTHLGKTVYEGSGIKLIASALDPQVLILKLTDEKTPLELKTLSIPEEYLKGEQYKQIIVDSAAEKVVMNGTSLAGASQQDAGTYSQLASKVSFYFPNAKSITNYLEDDGTYPDTTKSGISDSGADNYGKDNGKNYYHSFTIGSIIAPNATVVYHSGSINGYVFVKNLHQRDGMEIHNFYNPWLPEIEQEKEGAVSLHKRDSETNGPLAGAEFGIRKKAASKFIDVQLTGADGNLSFSGLDYGEYEIVETKAPAGYELSPTVHKVTIDENTPEVTLEAEDTKSEVAAAGIEVHKTDGTNHEELSGAVFGLRGLRQHEFIKETTDEDGRADFNKLTPGYYELVELTSPDGYQIDGQPHIIYVGNHEKKESIELTNEPKKEKSGSIQLTKIDASTGEPLTGVEFGVREFGQREFIKKKTDEQGIVTFTDLKPGAYYTVAELTTLAGYELTPRPLVVKISEGGQDLNIGNWTNQKTEITKKGSLKIEKTDKNTGLPLSGATFGIRALGQKEYLEKITNNQGEIRFDDLAQGIYEVRELKAPDGYSTTNLVKKINVGYNEQAPIVISKWENKKTEEQLGSAKIIKVDEDGTPLAGAEFAIRNDHEREFRQKAGTNESGEAYFNNLPLGKYEVIEIKAPAGYQLDGAIHHVFVTNDQTDKNSLTIKNYKKKSDLGQVSLEKRDKDTGKVLAGVVFTLEKRDGTVVDTYKTDKFGRIFVKDLAFGTYQFVEKKSLNGYELDRTPVVFTINKENHSQLLMLNMVNKKVSGTQVSNNKDRNQGYANKRGDESKSKIHSKTAYPKTNDEPEPLIMMAGIGLLFSASYLFYRQKERKQRR